jgi:nitrogen fixation protein FixH
VNTAAVALESYIFPGVLSAYVQDRPFNQALSKAKAKTAKNLTGRSMLEEAVLILLSEHQ